ncbi:MAG: hypothetical protein CFE44_06280 [Burkholderiales bacterium PBB4]|nr:MAG: hypothetical protein CFE44_06280 [Burkholderiales bacterium PBB4]
MQHTPTTLLVTAGCASSRSNVTVQESTKISKGQELNDLIRAKQAGALTDDEFESLRHTIMKRPN